MLGSNDVADLLCQGSGFCVGAYGAGQYQTPWHNSMLALRSCHGLVVETRTSKREVPGSIPTVAVVPLGKVLYPHCLVPRRGLKAVGPLVAYS